MDFVAAAIGALVNLPAASGKPAVYHLCNPHTVPLASLCAWLAASGGGPIRPLSLQDFTQHLHASAASSDLTRLLPLLDGGLPNGAAPSDECTRPRLAACGLACPQPSAESFARHVEYLRSLH